MFLWFDLSLDLCEVVTSFFYVFSRRICVLGVLLLYGLFLLFFGFFWFWFDVFCSASDWAGCGFMATLTLIPWSVPALNTFLLLSSGLFVTWCHHSSLCNLGLFLCVVFGLRFSALQFFEYCCYWGTLQFSGYGCGFFAGTGLHGLHVLVGSSLLFVVRFRLMVLG